jgi:UDP-N-acetylglucosamine 2-epimerase (non-hydrolysing)
VATRAEHARIALLMGTRPEVIKLAPVVRALAARGRLEPYVITSGQHAELADSFLRTFDVPVSRELRVMQPSQSPSQVVERILAALEPLLVHERPAALLVQGDTATTLAGALAAAYLRIPVGHVEAGLRTGNPESPFPEEMHRRLVGRLARWHFAATERNRDALLAEGVAAADVFVTGNPVVDSLHWVLARATTAPEIERLLAGAGGRRWLVVTMHRRESFGDRMNGYLRVLRRFVDRHEDVSLAFPVHPNPEVHGPVHALLGGVERIHLLPPLDYVPFVQLLAHAWLLVSDSGGVQEEAPSLGRALLVLRENTERPEAIEAGVARLVGASPERLRELLEESHADDTWVRQVREIQNPFGRGDAGDRIAGALETLLCPLPSGNPQPRSARNAP